MVGQEQFAELRARIVNQEQFEDLRVNLVAYESHQSASQTGMQQEAKKHVGEVSEGLKDLYTVATVAVGAVANIAQRIEEELTAQEERRNNRRGVEQMQGQKSLLHYKNMKVPVLEKMEGWRSWTADVEDYTEETMPGIRAELETAKKCDEEVTDLDMSSGAWSHRELVWRFLKQYTAGEARKVVGSAPNRNAWEAWRNYIFNTNPSSS